MKLSESKKGVKNPMYGKPLSMQHRKKISQSNMGKTTHNKGKKGYTNKGSFKKGQTPWNKEKKGVMPEPWNKGKKGLQTSWMKGKRHTKESREKISKAGKGRKHSEDWKNKASERMAGENNPFYGEKHDEPTLKIIKEKRLHQIFPTKDTIPEKILQEELRKRKIPFRTHLPVIGQPDIFIEPNICVMADSDWFHGYIYMNGYDCSKNKVQNNEFFEKKIQNDKKITQSLTEQGYNVLRFWEHEIKENPEKCLQKIIKIIKESRR